MLIFNSLIQHEKPSDNIHELTIRIESALSQHFQEDRAKYLKKAKSIVTNLQTNSSLVKDILTGELDVEKLATMNPQELASEAVKQRRQKIEGEAWDSRRSDWNRIHNPGVTGIYRCGKCKCNRTHSYQAQIRRADEPMTTFITCVECNHSWKQ